MRGSVGYVVAARVRLVQTLWAASMLRFSQVQFAGHDVGRYGALLCGAALGVEVSWP